MTSINTNTPSTTIRNNKRRRPITISTTTKLLIGVAATTLFNNQLIIHAKHPPSIHKNTKKNKHNTIRGNTNKPPIIPSNNNILIPLGSSNSNNARDIISVANEINGNDTLLLGSTNNGSGNVNNGGRVIVVQPNNLGSAHVASEWGGTEQISSTDNNSIQQNKQLQSSSSGNTYHSWPHPDTFNDENSIKNHDPLDPSIHPGPDQNPDHIMGSTNKISGELVTNNKMGKGQMGGHSTKFHGWVLGSTGGIDQNGGVVVQPNNLGAADPSGEGGESGVHYYQPNGYGSASSSQTLEVNQSPQGSTSSTNGRSSEKYDTIIETAVVGSAEVAAELLGSPLDEDVGHSVQVILRPRLTNDDGEVVNSPLGSSSSSGSVNPQSGGNNEPVVYYYDPAALQSTASSSTANGGNAGEESSTPELTLPETVYDLSGQALKLEDVHNGGRNEVFLEVQPRAVWGANSLGGSSASSGKAHMSDRLSSLQAKLQFTSSSGSSSNSQGTQSQDQLIVFFTIATMAVMVGMLSAQRLRSKKLLESCMGLDDDEDEEEEWTPNPIFGGQGQQQQVRYDKKFDTETTGLSPRNNNGSTSPSNSSDGFGALLGGRNSIGQGSSSNYYGTNDGGGLHFRGIGGDLEKFDV